MMAEVLRKIVLAVLVCLAPVWVFAAPMQQAITEYEDENYEEALQILETMRASESNAELSFYLGMTHFEMGHHEQAQQHLEEAQSLGMNNDRLYKALAESALATEDYDGAIGWLRAGEEAGFRDGEMAYLRGVAQARNGDYDAALKSLDEAQARSPEMSAKFDYLRAQVHVAENDYDKAALALQKIVNTAPESDLAESAREYNRKLAKARAERRNWSGLVQLGGMYDSNAIAEPEDTSSIPGLPDAEDYAFNGRFRLEYAPQLTGRVFVSARYDVNAVLYDENSTSDQLAHDVSVVPGMRFSNSSLIVPITYTHMSRDDDAYQQEIAISPTYNLNLGTHQVLQLGAEYVSREMLFDYVNAATEALESREGDIYLGRLGYYYLFAQRRGMANFRYEYVDERTDGLHWENQGHRIAVSALVPISKEVSADVYGETFFQDYDQINTIFGEQRSDAIKVISTGVTWQMHPKTSLYARYQYTRADSNIFLYEYRRHLAMTGVEFAF